MGNDAGETITIFEDYPSALGKLDADRAATLSSFKEIVGSQNCTLESDGTFTFRRYVGFICKDNIRLQILPKIYAPGCDPGSVEEEKASLSFLYNLLAWSGFLSHKVLTSSSVGVEEGDLVEILIKIFIDCFLHLYSRSIHYAYERYEDDLVFVKGKILFPETFQTSTRRPGFLHVVYDEFSIDNPLNRIFRSTMRRLIATSSSPENKKLLRQGLCFLEDVTDIELTREDFTRVSFNRNNSEYGPLFRLARLFYGHMRPSLRSGETRTLAFLVPLNRLFEYFVFTILREIPGIGGEVIYHSRRYLGTNLAGGRVFKVEPDFIIRGKHGTSMILDTKYKNPLDSSGSPSISSQDIYQICTYAQRYHCLSTALIYPRFVGQVKKPLIERYALNSAIGNIRLSIIQIDITRDDKQSILQDLSEGLGVNETSPERSF